MNRMVFAAALGLAALTGAMSMPREAQALCVAPPLTGTWQGNDGGTYQVRQVGNVLWWIGRSSDGGVTWQNVFRGIRNGNTYVGFWADVGSNTQNSGAMTVRTNGPGVLERVSMTGGFGGTRWTRPLPPCNDH